MTAMSALEQALIARLGTLGRVPTSFLPRPDKKKSGRSENHG